MALDNGNSKLTRYEDVAMQLEQMLEDMSAGEKLPSVRLLMRRYGASQATIDRSLDILMKKGLTEHIPGRGVFVAERYRGQQNLHVDLCFFFKESTLIQNPFYTEMTARLLEEAHNHHLHLNMFVHQQMGNLSLFRQRIERSNPDAVILMCVNKQSFELSLRELNIPNLLLFPNAYDHDSTSLIIDNFQGIELAVDHLLGLGHEKIALLHGQGYQGWYMLDQEERIEAFYSKMKKSGKLVPSNFVTYGGFSAEEGCQAVQHLLEGPTRPTAIIANDYNAKDIIGALRQAGLSVPNDISVVGFDDISESALLTPPLTTVNVCWHEIARMTIEKVCQLLSGELRSGELIRTPTSLSLRETTAHYGRGGISGSHKTEGTRNKVRVNS